MLIDSIKVHLAASKNNDYRSRVRTRFAILIDFLGERNWISNEVTSRFHSNRDFFEIHDSDLTAPGLRFMIACYEKWLKSLDRDNQSFTHEVAKLKLERLEELTIFTDR